MDRGTTQRTVVLGVSEMPHVDLMYSGYPNHVSARALDHCAAVRDIFVNYGE